MAQGKGELKLLFFASRKLPIDNVSLCRPSPGVFRGGIKGTNWYKGVVQSQKS